MTGLLDHPYGEFLLSVSKPARYIGGEWGECVKPHEHLKASICLVFPDIYEIGMSYLGFKILYALLNNEEAIAAERCFAPWLDMESELRKRDLPLVSLETRTPLAEFDALGFSFQHELSYTNFLNILDLSKIPLTSDERTDSHPFIIGGGPMAANPEPLAEFCDIFVVGDGEETLPKLLLALSKLKKSRLSRKEILIKLSEIRGVYIPSLYETEKDETNGLRYVSKPLYPQVPKFIERAFVGELDRYPFPAIAPVPHIEASFDRFSIEVSRGCDVACRFCLAGSIYRPMRPRLPQAVLDSISAGLRFGGYDEAALTSLSTSDYPFLAEVLSATAKPLSEEGVSLALSSLRAYGIEEPLFELISGVRETGLTFAPEAGSERLRRVINKNISDADIERSVEAVFSRRWQKIKLYFILGLPTETDKDLAEIIGLAKRLLEIARRASGRKPAITVSVSSFVPKPHTPFQWNEMIPLDEIERRQKLLLSEKPSKGITVKRHNRYMSFIEGVFSRGDRALGKALLIAFKKGARFDSWDDVFRFDLWQEAFAEAGIEPERYLRAIPLDSRLPWEHLRAGESESFLKREYEKAQRGEPTPPCKKTDEGKIICSACGAPCEPKERFKALEEAKTAQKGKLAEFGFFNREKERFITTRKLRIKYTKLNQAIYLGHLDTIRAIQRTFRRAGIKMEMTKGFNQQPDMAYAPPLKLGLQSIGELLDVNIKSAASTQTLLDLLNEHSIAGIRFLSAAELTAQTENVTAAAQSATYGVFFNRTDGQEKKLLSRWDELKRKIPVVVRDAKDRKIDITPILPSLRELAGDELNEIFSITGENLEKGFAFDIEFTSAPSPLPQNVAETLFPSDIIRHKRVTRLSINISKTNDK
ncbi:MAG: TIGR03960 family B12-binding radical SAM protein [Myxococcota bacterium]